MQELRHVWWVMTHNNLIIGIWWFVIVILLGILITRTLTLAQKVLTTFYRTVSTNAQWHVTMTQAVVWLIKVVTWVCIIAIVGARIGVPAGLITALGTIIGAAVGFGSQEMVKDVVKGSVHLLEKQFSVGDYVGLVVGGADHEGVVRDVSLRTLTLATEEQGVVTIPQGSITLIKNYSRTVGEFVVRLPFDTATPVGPIISLVEEITSDIHTKEHALLQTYLTNQDIQDITEIFDIVVRGVSSVDAGKIIIQVKGEATPGNQFAAKRALLKAIAGHLEKNEIQFYSTHLPERVV